MKLRSVLLMGAIISTISCATINKTQEIPETLKHSLSLAEAENRARILSEVVYELHVNISPKGDKFSGTLKAGFNLSEVPNELRLDFSDGEVSGVKVNKAPVTNYRYDGTGIYLPQTALVKGLNVVEVNYSHNYSNDARGLHRYKDSIDGETYLYTDFEPYDANRFMPCFDQPDLKATLTLSVTAPAQWELVSTSPSVKKKIVGDQRLWKFATTPKMSTYLFSLIAGGYKVFTDRYGKMPLRLLARKSFAKYVDANWWFKITKQGFAFYNKYFDYEYPFGKYDQIIVPEFASGAMENVAAVTFSERYFSRSQSTREELVNASGVILHEMAHMWFGNLVTMKWWKDLWLNESFATYMATLAQYEATEFKEAWNDFFTSDKSWAYWEDQLVTTHPIEAASVNSTSDARANFDGITYGKGAAVMKQLSYYIGKDSFQKGVRTYMRKYGFSNATLADFIGSLQAHTAHDLTAWSKVWLREAGVDTLNVKLECDNNKVSIARLELKSATSSNRPHSFQVGVFEKQNNTYRVTQKIDITMEGETAELKELVGKQCPGFIFPNYNDHAYMKIYFDLLTLEKLKSEINLVPEPLVRAMAWSNLWQMVIDQKMPIQNYTAAVQAQISGEKDLLILNKVLETVLGRGTSEMNSALYYMPASPQKNELIVYLEGFFLKQIENTKPGSDQFKLWVKMLAKVAQSPGGLTALQEQLKNNLVTDPDLRWQMLWALCRRNFPGNKAMLAKESSLDKSERGVRSALACAAAIPDAGVKAEWMAKLLEPKNKMPMAQKRAIMRNIFLPGQEQLFEPHTKTYFDVVANRDGSRDNYFVEEFSENLLPRKCTRESSETIGNFIASEKNLEYPVRRELLIGQQEDRRCVGIRDLAKQTMKAD